MPADAESKAIALAALYFSIVGRGGDDECLKRFHRALKCPPSHIHHAVVAKTAIPFTVYFDMVAKHT